MLEHSLNELARAQSGQNRAGQTTDRPIIGTGRGPARTPWLLPRPPEALIGRALHDAAPMSRRAGPPDRTIAFDAVAPTIPAAPARRCVIPRDRRSLSGEWCAPMSTPLLTAMFGLMIVIAWLAGVEPWMIGIGAVLAVIGYLLERRRGD